MRKMAVKFCPECKSILKIEVRDNEVYYVCSKGHYEEKASSNKITKRVNRENKVVVIANQVRAETITKIRCPKCGHDEAYTWIVQTRSGDEGPTIFYRCTRCSHTWRVYT